MYLHSMSNIFYGFTAEAIQPKIKDFVFFRPAEIHFMSQWSIVKARI